MRLTVNENTILKAIGENHPIGSSVKKLVTATGMARNEVIETLNGLKVLQYLSLNDKNEVYLKTDGRKYLGMDGSNGEAKSPGNSTAEIIAVSGHRNVATDIEPTSFVGSVVAKIVTQPLIGTSSNVPVIAPADLKQHSVLTSIDDLGNKLNRPAFEINDLDLKSQALVKLAALMSDDIAKLLLEIESDLERAAA